MVRSCTPTTLIDRAAADRFVESRGRAVRLIMAPLGLKAIVGESKSLSLPSLGLFG